MAKKSRERTPAPWTYIPEGDGDGEVFGIDHFVIGAGGAEIACLAKEADAVLIAAAPDYHAACAALLAMWPLSGYELEAYMSATFIPAIEAAQNKASGK